MPGLLMHAGATVQCPHQAPAKIVPTQARVLVSGTPVALITDQITATGCPFTVPPGKPQPCALAKWAMPSARVKIMGRPAMVLPSPGPGPGMFQSADQIPQGPPVVTLVQTRVVGM